MSVSDRPSAVGAAEATAMAELAASAASRWNILLYGIQLRRSQVSPASLRPAWIVFFVFFSRDMHFIVSRSFCFVCGE